MTEFVDTIDDHAVERADPKVGRDIPDADVELRLRQEIKDGERVRIVYRCQVETSGILFGVRALMPDTGRVALDDFAEGVADRLQEAIAGSEAVGAHRKATAHRRTWNPSNRHGRFRTAARSRRCPSDCAPRPRGSACASRILFPACAAVRRRLPANDCRSGPRMSRIATEGEHFRHATSPPLPSAQRLAQRRCPHLCH